MPLIEHARADASPTPLQLRRVHPLSAALVRRMGRGLQWLIDSAQSEWHSVELTLAPTDHWPSPGDLDGRSIQWRTRHGLIEIEDPALLTVVTGLQIPPHEAGGIPDDLLHWACSYVPVELQEALGAPVALVTASADGRTSLLDDAATPPLAVLLTLISAQGEPHTFLLRSDVQTMRRWTSDPGWTSLAKRPRDLPRPVRSIQLDGGLWLGSLNLTTQRLSSLRRGDALILPSEWGDESPPNRLLLGNTLINLHQTEDGFYQFQGWGGTRVGTSNPSHQDLSAPSPLSVDALKIEIDVLVGHLSMTVEQLAALAQGQVLPLDLPSPPRVRLVANGQVLGAGELVEIGQQLAIEIIDWGQGA